MLSQSEQQNEFRQLMAFINANKKKFILVGLICGALSGLLTIFIPKEYSSTAIIFPPAGLSLDYNVDNPNFGYDVEADRLLQILQSKELRDSVINKFDLIQYYKLNKAEKDWLDKLNKRYKRDITFNRTQYMSIQVTAQTTDPEMSANMVNYILKLTDKVREKIYKQNIILAYNKTNEEYIAEKTITDSLFKMLKNDLTNLNISSLVLLAPNTQLSFNFDQLTNVKNNGKENLELGAIILQYRYHLERHNDFEVRLQKTKKILESPVAGIYVVDKAEPSYKKVYPSFTLNIIASSFIGILITALVIAFRNKKETLE